MHRLAASPPQPLEGFVQSYHTSSYLSLLIILGHRKTIENQQSPTNKDALKKVEDKDERGQYSKRHASNGLSQAKMYLSERLLLYFPKNSPIFVSPGKNVLFFLLSAQLKSARPCNVNSLTRTN